MEGPLGLTNRDTLEDAFLRADKMSSQSGYSGIMVGNKDVRRIVLLSWHLRRALKALEEKQNDLTTKVKTPAAPTPEGEIKPKCKACRTHIYEGCTFNEPFNCPKYRPV